MRFQPLFPESWHLKKNGAPHFSLIGPHLESVSRSEPVLELNLAPSDKRPTYKFQSDSGIRSPRVNVTSSNHCASAWQRSKVTELKIEQNPSLVKLVERII